jgi:hypothetical protein
MPVSPRLTAAAEARLERMQSEGHSIRWGRGSDGRSAFYWARVTPSRTASERNVRAADGDALITKVEEVVGADPASHLVAALSDPFRSCVLCESELSFNEDGTAVFACPRSHLAPGHTVITAF